MAISTSISNSTEHSVYYTEVASIEKKLKKKSLCKSTIEDIALIRERLLKAAENDIPKGYYLLGKISEKGIGVIANANNAMLFYNHGSESNDAACIRAKGLLLHPNKIKETKSYLVQAADLGDKKACVIIGKALVKDRMLLDQAEKYLTHASAMGSSEGSYQLWKLKQENLDLLISAAEKGHKKAIFRLVEESIDNANKIKYLKILADKGDLFASAELAEIYEIENNYQSAYQYYILASENYEDTKRIDTLYALARLLEKWDKHENNLLEAREVYRKIIRKYDFELHAICRYITLTDKLDLNLDVDLDIDALEEAALSECSEAAYALSIYYGSIYESDLEKGLKFLYLAAEQKHPEALYDLGRIFRTGSNMIPKDVIASILWLKLAGEAGYAKGFYLLGCIYEKGELLSADPDKANEYFEKAKEMGYVPQSNHSEYTSGEDDFFPVDEL